MQPHFSGNTWNFHRPQPPSPTRAPPALGSAGRLHRRPHEPCKRPSAGFRERTTRSTRLLGAESTVQSGGRTRPRAGGTAVPGRRTPARRVRASPATHTPGDAGTLPRALLNYPPVSLKSSRKFWESCFTACSLNNLMISRIVGNGGRRKVVSALEAAMSLRNAVQASRGPFPESPRAAGGGGAWSTRPTSVPTSLVGSILSETKSVDRKSGRSQGACATSR